MSPDVIRPELLESTSLMTASFPLELANVLVLAVQVKFVVEPVAESTYVLMTEFRTGFVDESDIAVSTVTLI